MEYSAECARDLLEYRHLGLLDPNMDFEMASYLQDRHGTKSLISGEYYGNPIPIQKHRSSWLD